MPSSALLDRPLPRARLAARRTLAALPAWARPRVPTDTWEPAPADRAGVSWRAAARVLAGAALVVAVAAAVFAPPDAHAQPGVLDQVRNQYAAMTRAWIAPMSAIGRRLFVTLAGIEFTISSFLWLGRSEDLTEIARRFLLKFILISFLLMLITGASYWLPPIVNSFAVAAQRGSVLPLPTGPTGILDIGMQFAFDDLGNMNIPWSFEALGAVLFKLIAQVIVVVCFTAVAAQLLLVWVEAYIALGGGVLFLGFAGFRATASYAENYLNYLVYCGVKLFAFYLVVALGVGIVQQARAVFGSNVTFDIRVAGNILAVAVVFALLSLRIPSSAAARVAGGANLGIGHALRGL